MKGNIFILCVSAILLSLIALIISIIAFWSSCNWNYDSGNAIMSAFSILLTILICAITILIAWQVYNHYVAKEEVKKMIGEEAEVLAKDIWSLIDSNTKAEEDTCHFIVDTPPYDMVVLRNNAIDYAMLRFHLLYIECTVKDTQMSILKGKRKEYEYICNGIEHKYIEELKDYLNKAIEEEKKE